MIGRGKRLLAAEATGATHVTRGRTADNRAHLAETFVADIEAQHAGTRLGRQELDGELIEDLEGALWTRDLIERCRAAAVAHAGDLRAPEDQMAGFIGGGDYQGPGNSPDRADALVWALTELMLGPRARRPGVRRL